MEDAVLDTDELKDMDWVVDCVLENVVDIVVVGLEVAVVTTQLSKSPSDTALIIEFREDTVSSHVSVELVIPFPKHKRLTGSLFGPRKFVMAVASKCAMSEQVCKPFVLSLLTKMLSRLR